MGRNHPKKFLQYISTEHAKKLLKEQQATLFDTAMELGLSGTGRLHDLFINIEGMTPAEYKNGGQALTIHFSFAESPFGNLMIASTHKGICHMAFEEEETKALNNLKIKFPNARFQQKLDLLATKCPVHIPERLVAIIGHQTAFEGN